MSTIRRNRNRPKSCSQEIRKQHEGNGVTVLHVLIGMALVLTSCVNTRVVSFTSPNVEPKQATSLVVMVATPNLVLRTEIEDALARRLAEKGISVAPMTTVVHPTLRLSVDSSLTLAAATYDMALVVVNDGSLRTTPTHSLTHNEEWMRSEADYEFDLIDLPSKTILWVGSTTSSTMFADEIPSSVIAKITTRLVADGFLPSNDFRIPSNATPPYKGTTKFNR
ncbi:MAG: hypothetical protein MUC47_06630 [Candidatus Kapabacteria bacterium]|jgi:hypothetical protein|nr:hypothetical protein [Candidatus Kapabacteria bacterium]